MSAWRFVNSAGSVVTREIGDGIESRLASELSADELAGVEPYQPPAPTAADGRQEAQRRIFALVGATDFNGCIVRQLNASMRATELTNRIALGSTLSAAEQAEATALQTLANRIMSIRVASNAMEVAPPASYRDDAHWPT